VVEELGAGVVKIELDKAMLELVEDEVLAWIDET